MTEMSPPREIKSKPSCFGSMYELGEKYMADHCMRCRAFNECKDIGYGVDLPHDRIPMEASTDHEYMRRW